MVEITSFDPVEGQYHIAVFGVYLPQDELYLENVKLCNSKKGGVFIRFPQYKNENQEWCSLYRWNESKSKAILSNIYKALRESGKIESNPPSPSQSPIPF